MKRKILALAVLLLTCFMPFTAIAKKNSDNDIKSVEKAQEVDESKKINVYIFKGATCGYCARALAFFESIEEEFGKYFNLVEYEVWHDENNKELMDKVAKYFKEDVNGVPYIIIGDKTFGGYSSEFDEDIKNTIVEKYNDADYEDIVAKVKDGNYKETNYDTIIVIGIFAVVIGGFGALIYFSRKK